MGRKGKTARAGNNICPALGRRDGCAGFTLLEIVCVLVLVALLAVVASNRLATNTKAVIEADALKAVLRYAQARAMSDVYTWGVRFSAGGYTLLENNPNVAAVLPGQGTATRTMPSGVNIATAGLTNNTIYFDWRGQPVTAAITAIGGASTPAASVQTIRLTESSAVSVTVTPYTGFVP